MFHPYVNKSDHESWGEMVTFLYIIYNDIAHINKILYNTTEKIKDSCISDNQKVVLLTYTFQRIMSVSLET